MNPYDETQKLAETTPRLIALCGNPGSGKSTAQRLLEKHWGFEPVDDGFALRDFAMRHLGLTHDQVYTQEGKREVVTIAGKDWMVRDLLGQFGNQIEAQFGSWGIPHMALMTTKTTGRYSFGSVRRDQGAFYQKHGGIVVEIVNPDAGPSQFEFDSYDASIANYRILNNGIARRMHATEALLDLRQKLERMLAVAA